ncbi:MAG: T9SS type A sorting domain-containing protein [bacterium]
MNRKNRQIFFLTIILILNPTFVWSQSKNILRIHFETARVKAGTKDVVLNAFYKIEAHHPYTFTGFDYAFNYDQTLLRPTTAFFQGTASENAAFAHGNPDVANNIYHVLVSNFPASLDTNNHTLFQIWYTIKSDVVDSAMIAPIKFALDDSDGIDSVFIDNGAWDSKFAWHPFGILFKDTTKIQPPPPNKASLHFTAGDINIPSDSIRTLSLNVGAIDSSHIRSMRLEFDLDTLVFDSVRILKGTLLQSANMFPEIHLPHVIVSISTLDSFMHGSGELLRLEIRSKHRTDTVCSKIELPKLSVLNTDALFDTAYFDLGSICAFGKPKVDTTTKGVLSFEDLQSDLEVFPNPARSFVKIWSEGATKFSITISDCLGKSIVQQESGEMMQIDVSHWTSGMYEVEAVKLGKSQAPTRQRKKFFIVH